MYLQSLIRSREGPRSSLLCLPKLSQSPGSTVGSTIMLSHINCLLTVKISNYCTKSAVKLGNLRDGSIATRVSGHR